MIAARTVQVSTDKIISVIAVRNSVVSTSGAVLVSLVVR